MLLDRIFLERKCQLITSKATLNNNRKRLLSNGKLLLEVLLHLYGNNVKYSHKRQIAKLQIILISNCQNYQMT